MSEESKKYTDEEHDIYKKKIMKVFMETINRDAQDILLIEGERPSLRVKGRLIKMSGLEKWTIGVFDNFLSLVYGSREKGLFDRIVYENGGSLDFNLSMRDKNLRCHVYTAYPKNTGDVPRDVQAVITIRVVPKEMPSIDKLNLPDISTLFNKDKGGLFLVSGRTGDGKSTTVAGIVNEFNKKTDKNRIIVTIEDPVEFVHENRNAWVIQRRVGDDTESYERATADALREDADIVVIGELRTASEMQSALQLAMVGKLVIATIHSNGVVDTFERYVNAFAGDMREQVRTSLVENLLGILHQNLLTLEDSQYPLTSLLMVANDDIRSELREQGTREKLEKMMRMGNKEFVQTREDGLDRLIAQGVIDKSDKYKYL